MLFLISGTGNVPAQGDNAQVGKQTDPSLAAQYYILRTITKNFGVPDLANATPPNIQALIPPL